MAEIKTELNETDAGTQQGLFGNTQEVKIIGKGRVVQTSMDDLLKLNELKEEDIAIKEP